MILEAIRYSRGKLEILDQLQLPHREEYIEIRTPEDGWDAIRSMKVRGAPAIAIVAALSIAVWAHNKVKHNDKLCQDNNKLRELLVSKLDYLVTSRPTAVNLADAVQKLKRAVAEKDQQIIDLYIDTAERMLIDDINDNENIGKHGADWLIKNTKPVQSGTGRLSVLTHCNTGSLATAGYGTALGIVRSLHNLHVLKKTYYTETRPYNQGSRLTGYELIHDGIPATLITDSMAGALMRLKGVSDSIGAVVVGADRVVANGDTANKVGTYSLAILARHHGLKFVVAAPRTTIDLQTASGNAIVIEERSKTEMTTVTGYGCSGGRVDHDKIHQISTAAENTRVWNPAFDVTPAELIDAIVTEVGVVEKNGEGIFDLRALMEGTG